MEAQAAGPHVVIIGGFLTESVSYLPLRARLLEREAGRVTIARLHLPDWLAMGAVGMGPVMLRGARAIREARRVAPAPLIVVGHSAGGLITRLAMAPEPIDGRFASIADDVGCLVTLGTPNTFDPLIAGWRHAGLRAAESLERITPGAWFAPRTAYVSVGSRRVPPSPLRPSLTPAALGHTITRIAVGQTPGAWGDGLVDEVRSRLPGARHLVFDDVLHGVFGGPWYGDAHVIDRWWPVALELWRGALEARRGEPDARPHAPATP